MRFLTGILFAFSISAAVFGQEKHKPIRTFDGHTDKVTCVAVTPDGKHFFSGSDDRTIRYWDIDKTEPIRVLKEHQNYVLALALSRDGKQLLSAGGGQWRGQNFATETDQIVRLWDAAELKVVKKMAGHQAPVWRVALDPDDQFALSSSGGYVAIGNNTPAGHTIKLWDLTKGATIRDFQGHESWVRDIAFLPGGKSFVSGGWDKTLRVWDLEKNEATRILRDHKDNIDGIAVSRDGKWLVSGGGKPQGGGDTTIRLWDLAEGKVVKRFPGHTKRVWKLAFTKDGQRFLSAAADNTIRLWDTSKDKAVALFAGHTDEVRQAIFTPDGTHILSASHDKTVRLWKVP